MAKTYLETWPRSAQYALRGLDANGALSCPLRDPAFVAHRLTLGCHGVDWVRSLGCLRRWPGMQRPNEIDNHSDTEAKNCPWEYSH